MKRRIKEPLQIAIVLSALLVLCGNIFGEEVKKIQDNSFLIEEAYNQEEGVVQHIQNFQYLPRSASWSYNFTQEWPAPNQTHQLSYTVPITHIGGDSNTTGLGDVFLNYRYQLIMNGPVALAPRFSLILPTGDYERGLGSGALGYQINIPLSMELSEKWVTHWNMGMTYLSGARAASGEKADTLGYNLGGSIIYLFSENFNLLTELVWNSMESVETGGFKEWKRSLFINPGVRYAFNFKSGLQVVPGLSFPIGLGPSSGEYGILLYLSLEHPLF